MRKSKFSVPGREVEHALVGKDVRYRNRVWKVIAAQVRVDNTKPWLILKDGFSETSAKPNDIELVFD